MQKKKPLKRPRTTQRKKTKKTSRPFLRGLKFLPAVILFAASIGLHQSTRMHHAHAPHNGVLSYATSISQADLLAQTNTQRSGNGVANLGLNGQLNTAAQTKANDMVSRNYWSHNTPDGKEPWTFIANAGYQYQTAGENLAYGFETSSETVTGWMNSPPHRENLLNSAFSEVGFGFANSPNFVNDGEQTVVVAMYAAPLSQPAPAAQAAPVSNSPPSAPVSQPQSNSPTAAPTSNPPVETIQTPTPAASVAQQNTKPATTSVPTVAKSPKAPTTAASVRRIQLLTGGDARWSGTLLVTSMCGVGVFWALERRRQLKHFALSSEHFILKHLHIDLAVAGFITLGLALLQTSGLVR